MKRKLIVLMSLAATAVASLGAVPDFYDDFDGSLAPYSVGQVFTNTAVTGWQASGTAAYVTNVGAYLSAKAMFMGAAVALTNSLASVSTLKVWTDFRIHPTLGEESWSPPTNTSSFYGYFNSNGMVVVATTSGVWQVCTNDVWGNPVPPATNNAYVRISVFQDYNTSNQAVFLNDQLLVQDMRFAGSPGAYNRLLIQNTESNCWLDNVWVKTNVSGLVSNRNGDAMADADEVQQYGYARRTFYVSKTTATNLTPLFTSMTNALAVCRARDVIHVIAGDYSGETITMAANQSNVIFEGDAFTVSGLTVEANASASFAQSVSCGILSLTGQVAMATGASMTSSTANVVGSLSVSANGAFVVTNLTVVGSGLVSFTTNAMLVAVTAGVTMNGPFSISNTWGSASVVSMPLPFSDNFDAYADNTVVTNLKFRGWNASDGGVKVQSAVAHGSGKAVVLPDGTVLSNSISAVGITKIWTDYYVRPVLGVEPAVPATGISSFLSYADTNGYLVVATNGGGWVVCSNQLNQVQPVLLQNTSFTRITLCQDLTFHPPKFAVFVAGNLVAQGLSSPADIRNYASFTAGNLEGMAYVDDVLITTAIPSGLTSDLDLDGTPDAYEIQNYGLTTQPSGSIYKFR